MKKCRAWDRVFMDVKWLLYAQCNEEDELIGLAIDVAIMGTLSPNL
jgi:hypothetical protein